MTTEELPFQADRKTIAEILFSHNKFRVPEFQREYSWEEDQISEFWNDIMSPSNPHFIGAFVLNFENIKNEKTEERFIDIIDGQQRILTISIFLAVLRNIAKAQKLNIANKIQTGALGFSHPVEDTTETRILCGKSVHDFYMNNIQKEDSDIFSVEAVTKEEKRIKTNAEYFRDKIKGELKEGNSDFNEKIIKAIYAKVREIIAVQIRIENEDDAFEIFETLNARGINLALGDLLKNLIFGKLKTKENVETRWDNIINNLKSSNIDLARFIRYYWLSKYGFFSGKKIFKEIKKTIKTPDEYDLFLDELNESSNLFKIFVNNSLDEWEGYQNPAIISTLMEGIKVMGVTQCYVLYLSLFRNYNNLKTKCISFLELVEKFSFQYFFISKLPANKVERIYSKIALDIEQHCKLPEAQILNKINSAYDELKDKFVELKPEKAVFLEKFDNIEYKNNPIIRERIRYILDKIDKSKTTGEHKIDFTKVNLEHVLPLNPIKWGLTKGQIKNYVNKLGNLTPVSIKINEEIDNDVLNIKLPELEKSEIKITQEFVDKLKALEKWEEEDILGRHKELAEISYDQVWKYW